MPLPTAASLSKVSFSRTGVLAVAIAAVTSSAMAGATAMASVSASPSVNAPSAPAANAPRHEILLSMGYVNTSDISRIVSQVRRARVVLLEGARAALREGSKVLECAIETPTSRAVLVLWPARHARSRGAKLRISRTAYVYPRSSSPTAQPLGFAEDASPDFHEGALRLRIRQELAAPANGLPGTADTFVHLAHEDTLAKRGFARLFPDAAAMPVIEVDERGSRSDATVVDGVGAINCAMNDNA